MTGPACVRRCGLACQSHLHVGTICTSGPCTSGSFARQGMCGKGANGPSRVKREQACLGNSARAHTSVCTCLVQPLGVHCTGNLNRQLAVCSPPYVHCPPPCHPPLPLPDPQQAARDPPCPSFLASVLLVCPPSRCGSHVWLARVMCPPNTCGSLVAGAQHTRRAQIKQQQ